MGSRVIMHVDLDYFYAQCEERENSSLKGKAVVVCVYSGRTAHSGAVSTSNYIARSYGVKAGIPIVQAEKILKDRDAIFLPVNMGLYNAISEKVMSILRGYAESFEQVGIDEAFLDVTRKVAGDFEEGCKLAFQIKEDVKAREQLTCSIGVGPNKLVAKIASDFKKPNGLTVVKPEDVRSFLYPLPVSRLYGVGKKTEEKLEILGIKTIGDLAGFDVNRLVDFFGGKMGVYFHSAANGVDEEPVQERGEAEQISRISTLKENTREFPIILSELRRLSKDVYSKSKDQGYNFTSISVIAVMEDLSVLSKTKSLEEAAGEEAVIFNVAEKLLQALLKEKPQLSIRRIGVRVAGLLKETGQKPLNFFLGQ